MTTTTTNQTTYFNVFAEKIGRSKREDTLIRIGVAFPHKNGAGFNIELESLPLTFNGKLVILPPKERDDSTTA